MKYRGLLQSHAILRKRIKASACRESKQELIGLVLLYLQIQGKFQASLA